MRADVILKGYLLKEIDNDPNKTLCIKLTHVDFKIPKIVLNSFIATEGFKYDRTNEYIKNNKLANSYL